MFYAFGCNMGLSIKAILNLDKNIGKGTCKTFIYEIYELKAIC